MAINFLEQLVAEWYEYQGYFVRRNTNVGKRPEGGHECELDVVAFHPSKRHLVHVEASMDAESGLKREQRFSKKFVAGRKYIPALFDGLALESVEIEQMALLVFTSKTQERQLAGAKVVHVGSLLREVVARLAQRSMLKGQVPEQFPILRSIQFVTEYRKDIFTNELI
jgi:hypothetical protein